MNRSNQSFRPVVFALSALTLTALLPDSSRAGQPRDTEIRFTCAQLAHLGEPLEGACAVPARKKERVALANREAPRAPGRSPRG